MKNMFPTHHCRKWEKCSKNSPAKKKTNLLSYGVNIQNWNWNILILKDYNYVLLQNEHKQFLVSLIYLLLSKHDSVVTPRRQKLYKCK